MKRNKAKYIVCLLAACLLACVIAMTACGGDGKVTVTFYNGTEQVAVITGKAGDAITDEIPLQVKTGYEFTGWATEPGEAFTAMTLPKKSVKLYAQFTANPYKVAFDAGKGVGTTTTVDAVYDAAVAVPDTALGFTRTGYTLSGWSNTRDADAADYALGGDIRNLTATKDETVTLYAYYTPNTSENDFVVENGVVCAYLGDDKEITLPQSATSVADFAFEDADLTNVVIPVTYTEIGYGAFSGCDNLEKLTVPFIGGSRTDNRFLAYIFGAATYTDNTFSYSLTNMGTGDPQVDESTLSGSFFIPRSLRVVTLNDEINEIPEGAFYYAYGLENLVIHPYLVEDGSADAENPEYTYRVKTVGKSAFEGCHRIGYNMTLEINNDMSWMSAVETIGEKAFKGYIADNDYFGNNLRYIPALEDVRTIGNEAFMYNSSLSGVAFGDKLQSIGDSAFENVSLLQRIVIPDACQSIGSGAFRQCLFLASVDIGEGVQTIGDEAFALCAGLTEVFFRGETVPTIGRNAFRGFDLDTRLPIDAGNPGLVFYVDADDDASQNGTANRTALQTACAGARIDIAGEESDPYYCISNGYDFYMTFSGGHTVILHDPYLRIGFGIPTVVGTYVRETEGVWYDEEIYTATFLLDMDFTIKIGHYLTATYTHYYKYMVDTFDFSQQDDETFTSFTVGSKSDEWYLEENKWGQIGLWQNGEMVPLYADPTDPDGKLGKSATYAAGGISQFYNESSLNRSPRSFGYMQGNIFFEEVKTMRFVYVPSDSDSLLNYYGKLYLDDTETEKMFGNYATVDDVAQLVINEVVSVSDNPVTIRQIEIKIDDETVVTGSYETSSQYGAVDESVTPEEGEDPTYLNYTVTAKDKQNRDVTITFTDYLDCIVDGSNLRTLYARAQFTYDGTTYRLYNGMRVSRTSYYYVRNGEPQNDYYVLMQFHRHVENEEIDMAYDLYPGFGEHIYTASGSPNRDYLSYTYNEGEEGLYYQFVYEDGSTVQATVADEFVGSFSAKFGTSIAPRTYSPYYEEEAGITLTGGGASITLSGYGTATYTTAEGTTYTGKYNVNSDATVAQVYVTSNMYYNLVEYVFRASDGSNFTQYFVPCFYDAYDDSMHAGDMLLPDALRNRTYRFYDSTTGYCTGILEAGGYGMGILYIMVSEEGTVTPIDNTFFCPGAVYAYYEQIGTVNGQPQYKLHNGAGQGFLTFIPTNLLSRGHREDNMSSYYAFETIVGAEYDDWWQGQIALLVTGKLDPPLEDMVRMCAREELGTYTAPNGYTLTLDGFGNATLKNASGDPIQTAVVKSVDAGVLGVTKYPFTYTVGNVTYEGTIDTAVGIIRLQDFYDGTTLLDNFAKGAYTTYTDATYGTFTVYEVKEGQTKYVGRMYRDGGKTVYDMGTLVRPEEGEKYEGKDVIYFDGGKFVGTLSGGVYQNVQYFPAISPVKGLYKATAYFSFLLDSEDENGDPYPEAQIGDESCWFTVRGDENGDPVINTGSEYVGTIINTTGAKPTYKYYAGVCDLDLVIYADGEVISTYLLLNIIPVTNYGWYYPVEDDPATDEDESEESYMIIDRGNGIVKYTVMKGQG